MRINIFNNEMVYSICKIINKLFDLIKYQLYVLLLGDCNLPATVINPLHSGVDGSFGGVQLGAVIFSKNPSICRKLNALCSVSSGLIGGTPPNPSIASKTMFLFCYFIT